jgi:hypothetical protein
LLSAFSRVDNGMLPGFVILSDEYFMLESSVRFKGTWWWMDSRLWLEI